MRTKRKPRFKEIYFTSSINSEREKFEIIESSLNFSKKEFANDVKEQMEELQVEIIELSKATYINQHRLNSILSAKAMPTEEEIKEIKKKLHLT